MLLEILRWPDPRLSTPCAAVLGDDQSQLIADMFDTMYAAPGRGLAGPQVGVLQRLFVMDCTWKEGAKTPFVAINPDILWSSEETCVMDEGCLSIPGVLTAIERPSRIRLRWQDAARDWQEQEFDGFEARCIQHEFDHLNGLVTFGRLSAQARAQTEAAYDRQKDTPS